MTKVNIRFSTHKCVLKSQTTLKTLSAIWFVENWFGFYVCLILHDGKFDVRLEIMFIQCAMETEKICLEIAVLNIISTLLTLIKLSKITYFMPQIRKSVEYQRKINQKRNIIHCTVLTSIFVERYRQYNIFPWHNTVQKVIFMRLFFFQLCFANAQHHYYIKYKTASILIERDQCCWSVAYKMYASVRLPYNKSGPFERKWNKKNACIRNIMPNHLNVKCCIMRVSTRSRFFPYQKIYVWFGILRADGKFFIYAILF